MDPVTNLWLAVAFIALLLLHFLPALVAAGREHRQHRAIFVLNLLLGWTFIGWAIALVWALTEPREAPQRL